MQQVVRGVGTEGIEGIESSVVERVENRRGEELVDGAIKPSAVERVEDQRSEEHVEGVIEPT